MIDKIATQRTIEWILAQRTELESKMKDLTDELEKTQTEYKSFTALLLKLTEDSNSRSNNTQIDCLDYPVDINFEIEISDFYDFENSNSHKTPSEERENDNPIIIFDIDDYEDEADNYEENEENNSSPKDWLRPEYQNRPMEDVVFEILKQIQPAKPGDIALKLYEIEEYDPNFDRARNSANAALTNGKKTGKWKLLRRGVYVLNDYPESFNSKIYQNGYHPTYQMS